MPHEDESRERMLKAVYTHQVLMLGLARDTPDDEENDSDYVRMPVTFGEPETVGDRSFVASTEEITFTGYSRDAEKSVRFWLLFDVSGKRLTHDLIKRVGANEPRPLLPAVGEGPVFPAGAIRVGLL